MSINVSRPERADFDTILKEKIPLYEIGFQINLGLSVWAQVNYP